MLIMLLQCRMKVFGVLFYYLTCFIYFNYSKPFVSLPNSDEEDSYEMDPTALDPWKRFSDHIYHRWHTYEPWVRDLNFTTDLNMLVNPHYKKNQNNSIVDVAIIDDMKDRNKYCRCWRSKIFPLCDGAHNHWNNRTGDNVGPLFIKEKKELQDYTEWLDYMEHV